MLKRLLFLSGFLLLIWQPAFAENNTSASSSISKNTFTESSDEDFLPPDEAFKLNIEADSGDVLRAQFTIVPGYYLYKERIKFVIKDANQGKINTIDLPAGEIKNDPNFGKQEVYHHDFIAKINVNNSTKEFVLDATYQGCSEKGLCYAPQHKTFNLVLNNAENNSALRTNINEASEASSNDDQATTLLKGDKLWLVAVGFFGFGLLLALTPCVLPMIPILSGIIVGDKKVHHHATSRLHAFNLSLAYVLGMALSYTLAGIAAGLSGQLLSNALQNYGTHFCHSFIFDVWFLRVETSSQNRKPYG
jgi:thioredoxin:protein disulfide reductase